MIPSVISEQVRRGVEEFLRTTFPISTPFFADALEKLLSRPDSIFRGPYLSIKLPFQPAEGGAEWFPHLLPIAFRPYRHQEQAWARLERLSGRSTLVATGTGSGKTECFLYPILDYCHALRGCPGIKAILIYPMNALATDQARRLAGLIHRNPDLRGRVTAGLYIGEQAEHPAAEMGETEIITDKDVLRQAPPDILLTNYKMLDYLLIRPRDFRLWQDNSPEALKYLVVDELHTFDGAQGADLACLIRRIKERLKTPPGHLCCVGTSATLGGDAGGPVPAELLDFARRVFGEPFDEEAVIGESVMMAAEFLRDHPVTRLSPPGSDSAARLAPLAYATGEEYLRTQFQIWFGEDLADFGTPAWQTRLGDLLLEHAYFRDLLSRVGNRAVPFSQLLEATAKRLEGNGTEPSYVSDLLISCLSLASAAKRLDGKLLQPLVQIRHQLWLRELRRMVAPVAQEPSITFADDLKPEELALSLPLVHCRECGLTGWAGTTRDVDGQVKSDLRSFYTAFFAFSPQVVYLIPDSSKDPADTTLFRTYLCSSCLELQPAAEPHPCERCAAPFDRLIRVWQPEMTYTRERDGQSRRYGSHDCPACNGRNSLTILGSRAASLTSVIIAQLFASPFNADKKMLAFSDSVQDASHRAGFFGARTYAFNLRSAIQKVAQKEGGDVPFAAMHDRFLNHWHGQLSDPDFIATFLPPDMNWLQDYERLHQTGALPAGSNLMELVERRLSWEIWSEYTFNSRIGRTLEKTGASTLEIEPDRWLDVREAGLTSLREHTGLQNLNPATLERFLTGFLLTLKNRGGVLHADLTGYLDSLGSAWHLGKQKGRAVHRPHFGRESRAPMFLAARSGERFSTLCRSAVRQTPTWFEDWLAKCLGSVDSNVTEYAREVYEILIPLLVEKDFLFEKTAKGTRVWGLRPEIFRIILDVVQLRCRNCSFSVSAGPADVPKLEGGPCLRYRCRGTLEAVPLRDDYYRRLYEAGDVQRIFTKEHTGLLGRDTREHIEEGFRHQHRPGDPNLLSCTPTLEMGINIGDLSALALCSVPPKPSNYLQRVGRTGRVNGNSFLFTVANARPHDLFFFYEPTEMLEGLVEPPGCFLNAPAVLERQFTAFVFDRWVETGLAAEALPAQLRPVLDALEAGRTDQGFPANLLHFFSERRGWLEDEFLAMFGAEVEPYTREHIRAFCRGGDPDIVGMEDSLWRGLREVLEERRVFLKRIEALRRKIRQMQQDPAASPRTEEDLQQLQLERSALTAIVKEINSRSVLNFFTDEGLLPNYAFPEAGVQLRSIIKRYEPKAPNEEQKYKATILEYERPAASAILELAPANHFFAEGRKLEIDQISLQHSKFEVWRFCDTCSHMALAENLQQQEQCPKCGSTMWSDEGQRRTILRLRQVVSNTNEIDSRSYDESDDREPRFYQKNMFVLVDPAAITEAYFIDREEVPFGFEFFRKITLREVNFGPSDAAGGRIRFAGREFFDSPFEICRGCGKVKKDGRLDHAISCQYWGKPENEKVIEGCYLYREFSSEAIRMLLPVASFNVEQNLHSFVAALDLGLRRRYRGDPGHLLTTLMDEPVPGSDVRKRYLVLYDGVPGGTGYLKDLMRDKQNLINVFTEAYRVMHDCSCQRDSDKDGCYRCLLAYRGRHDYQNTSRRAAMELLALILENKEHLKPTARLETIRLNRLLESELEGQFIEALRRHAESQQKQNLTAQVVNGKPGYFLRLPTGNYLIEPQVELGKNQGVVVPSRADFIIYPERPNAGERPVAVFTDGYEYHADPRATLRTGIDTAQRLAILRSGKLWVWSLTWDDVQDYLKLKPPDYRSTLFQPGRAINQLLTKLSGAVPVDWNKIARQSSLGLLLLLLGDGRGWNWRAFTASYLLSLMGNRQIGKGDAFSLRDWLLDADNFTDWPEAVNPPPPGSPPWLVGLLSHRVAEITWGRAWVGASLSYLNKQRTGDLVACFRLEDASADKDPATWKGVWREYLRLMNLLQFVAPVDFVSGMGLKEQRYGTLLDETVDTQSERTIPEQAARLAELVHPALRALVLELAERGRPLPEPGYELANPAGEIVAVAELAWTDARIGVLLESQITYGTLFEQSGWHVFAAEAVIHDIQILFNALDGKEPA